MKPKHPPIDWDTQPLGQVSDSDLAARLGVSAVAVGQQRKKRGIARLWRPEVESIGRAAGIDWDAQPLGVETDGEIARRLGVSEVAVNVQRRKRGIRGLTAAEAAKRGGDASARSHRARGGADWDAQPLGRVSDAAIARRLDVSPTAVARQREKRGIAPLARTAARKHAEPKVRVHIDWDAVVFDGTDQAVADRLGVSVTTVCEHRHQRGLPSHHQARRAEKDSASRTRRAERERARHAREDEALRLQQEEGLTLTEIGRRLGVSRARVGQILAKARSRRSADRSGRRAAVRALIARARRHLAAAELRRRRLAHEAEIAARAQARATARVAAPLSARYAEVLRLADEEGLTYEAIGRRLGITSQRAHQIARKARARAGGMNTRR